MLFLGYRGIPITVGQSGVGQSGVGQSGVGQSGVGQSGVRQSAVGQKAANSNVLTAVACPWHPRNETFFGERVAFFNPTLSPLTLCFCKISPPGLTG
jgi:hypothetical protein